MPKNIFVKCKTTLLWTIILGATTYLGWNPPLEIRFKFFLPLFCIVLVLAIMASVVIFESWRAQIAWWVKLFAVSGIFGVAGFALAEYLLDFDYGNGCTALVAGFFGLFGEDAERGCVSEWYTGIFAFVSILQICFSKLRAHKIFHE